MTATTPDGEIIEYDNFTDFNQSIDEDGDVSIGSLSFKRSAILFQMDIVAYVEASNEFAESCERLGKLAGNTINVHSIVSCYLGTSEETWTSNTGQQVIKHELCVMGESEFCGE